MKKILLSLLLCAALLLNSAVIPMTVAFADETAETEYEIYPIPHSVAYTGDTIDVPDSVNLVLTDSLDEATVKKIKAVLDNKGISYEVSESPVDDDFNVVVSVGEDSVPGYIPPYAQGTISPYSVGDVNHDGKIDATDATLVLQKYAGIIGESYNGFDIDLANADGIGEIDAGDATIILQDYSGIKKITAVAAPDVQLPEVLEKTESYILNVEENAIDIIGCDTDGAFYGIVTLKWILEQCGDSIRTLKIEDYSDASIRGFIEGYYGIPWSDEDRISLMEFGGNIKMTSYVFAPKNDPYHSSLWTTLYPEDRLEEMKAMVQAGNDSKCRFVWTIHPFMYNQITAANYDERLATVKAKFEQLYGIGVRQFGILADDANSATEIQRRLCTDMTEWCEEKGDVYDLIFCPQQYNKAWVTLDSNGNSPYFTALTNGLPESVRLCWTGDSVCAAATQGTFDWFQEKVGREALMWINWPCNDINSKRLLMGRGELLNEGVTGFCGIISNPMQQAEPSKVALFAIADYTWNRDGWDMNKNWADSFKYIDPDVSDALYTMAKHLSDPYPNGHGENLTESEEIKPLLDEFTTKYNAGESIDEIGNTLINEMEVIIDACNEFQENASVEALREEMQPWTDSLRYLATAIKYYIQTALAFEREDDDDVWANYSLAAAAYSASKNCEVKNLNDTAMVEAGSKRLIPFASALADKLAEDVMAVVNPNGYHETRIITPSEIIKSDDFLSVYSGDEANIYDGDSNTFCWYKTQDDTVTKDGYIGYKFKEPKNIGVINIVQACSESEDHFANAVLEYSLDGDEYIPLCDVTSDNVNLTLPSEITAQYIRLRTKAETSQWYSISEFTVAPAPPKDMSAFAYTNVPVLAATAVDYNLDTATLGEINDEITLASGEYIGIRLSRIKCVDDVVCNTSMDELTLQYSVNGIEWSEEIPDVGARYIRLINNTENDVTGTISEFVVHSEEIYDISVKENNLGGGGDPLAAFDGDRNTRAHFQESQANGKYVIYDLGQTINIKKLNLVMYDGENDFIRNGKVSISMDAENWTDVIELGDGRTDVEMADIYEHDVSYYVKGNNNVGGVDARYIKVELTSGPGTEDKWTRFSEIEINDNEYRPTTTDPTFTQEVEVKSQKTPYKLIDNNVNTTYLPEKANSSVVYHISENTEITSIVILQSPNTVSNAVVSVRTGDDTWQTVGNLSESLNRFENLEYENIFDVKLVWEDVIPELHEIFFTTKEKVLPQVDKSVLADKYEEAAAVKERNYTEESYRELLKAMNAAAGVLNYEYSEKADVDAAIEALDAATEALQPRPANREELNALIQSARALNQNSYEAESWTMIQEAISKAEEVYGRETLYQADCDDATAELQEALDSMVMTGRQERIEASHLEGDAPSYQGNDVPANAVDGDDNTQWHTHWTDTVTIGEEIVDNYFTITLDDNYYVNKIEYLPRASQSNGIITRYKLYYSKTEDGDDFVEIKGGAGTWEANNDLKTVSFTQVNARRIKIVAIETAGGAGQENMFISAREFKVYQLIPNE